MDIIYGRMNSEKLLWTQVTLGMDPKETSAKGKRGEGCTAAEGTTLEKAGWPYG